MKRILVVLAVAAMVVSSCGMKTNAQGEEAKDKAAVETTVEATVEAEVEKACCEKDSTAKECTDAEKKACCEKDSTAKECTDAEKKACCEKEVKDTEGENTEA
ncbi:hypothetical protein KEM09_13835 [Carboxylicivirga mesophila]|uniref:Lipoprotein n=1 Tax=Carboxylicivirga mesophila TaxID=1166478 RepID=A0ABS5KCC6_9BACT|nr:hypothetical protein [Carboxylicivirga mesophila]MBS2212492.1 hypothetical protein [Carboxylicivirga mesophila]